MKNLKLPKIVSLCGNRKKINACKKAGLLLHNPHGRWNGYGFEKLPLVVSLPDITAIKKFNKICKNIDNTPTQKEKSYSEKKEDWCKRLARLTEITTEEAKIMAEEKEEYQETQINNLENKQTDEHYSRKREILINKIRRSNPLRYIKDTEHARNIIAASNRHTRTNYENRLEEGRELAQIGQIERSEVRNYARSDEK